jgi:hypothetical protein
LVKTRVPGENYCLVTCHYRENIWIEIVIVYPSKVHVFIKIIIVLKAENKYGKEWMNEWMNEWMEYLIVTVLTVDIDL